MKRILHFAIAAFSLSANAEPTGAWLAPVPTSMSKVQDWKDVPGDAFFEVSASRLEVAEDRLDSSEALAQDANAAGYYGRSKFKCVAPSRLYLIRALYENGGTGAFQLRWSGSALLVEHMSLGAAGKPQRSALIACLDHAPAHVYSSISGAL
jgi:hypothetical protein